MIPPLVLPRSWPPILMPLLLLLPLVTCQSVTPGAAMCDSEELRSLLADIDLPSCLARGSQEKLNCSLMRHLEQVAADEGKPLDYILNRATVLVFAHSQFAKELSVPNNPALEIEAELARHYAFFGVTKCLKASNSTCQRLRVGCLGGFASQFVFLVSGHCSKSFGCSPIYTADRSQPTTLLNMLPYIHYRLIERQAFIARELGELQLSTSISTEYLIQTELNDTYGSQLLLKDSKPLAVFVAGAGKTLTYYQQLVWFLDTALSLKNLFTFHVIVTPLSKLESESERPQFRWKVQQHESFLALYTKQLCRDDPTWAFSCKPHIILSSELLFAEQFTSHLLHTALTDATSISGPFLTIRAPSVHLNAFVHLSTSYVLAVMPVDEMLTDRMINWEVLKSLEHYLKSAFGVTYRSVIISKATALQTLSKLNTGIDLEQAFYRPSFFIRLANGAYVVLKIDEPIAVLDKTVRDVANAGRYQIILQSAREMVNSHDITELPPKMIFTGHIIGDITKGDDEVRDMVEETRVRNRTDAFVEQMHFKDVYNVTGVLVVESDPALMQSFFDKVGQDKPWLVLFTVSWSPLCKAARAVWSSVGQCARRLGFPEVQLVKVDCFEANEICKMLEVTSYPTITMFSKGIQLNTYSGPVVLKDLCLYVKLAFQPPILTSSSEQETRKLLDKLLTVKSRVFVLRSDSDMPKTLAGVAKSLRFQEVFVHQKSAGGGRPQLTAVYSDVRPSVSEYAGSLDDSSSLVDFVENGHLKSVFPCTWTYLPQALKREHPLVILFHLEAQDVSAGSLLDHLRDRFADRGAAFCQLNLRNFTHLNDLVRQLAGLSLPALVTLSRPPGAAGKVTHRLPLGAVPASELPARAADWLNRALGHRLTDGRPVEPSQRWEPASQAFNFVDQVYHGKAAPDGSGQRPHSRTFTLDGVSGSGSVGEAGGDDGGDYNTMSSSKMAGGQPMMASSGSPVESMHDEL